MDMQTHPAEAPVAGIASASWYLVARSGEVKRGQQVRRIVKGQPVLVGRRGEGDLFAMRDICPHRLVPLSAGRQVETAGETTVECPYHGWRFGTDGVCRLIPSLMEDDPYRACDFRVAPYGVVERAGAIFVGEVPGARLEVPGMRAGFGPPGLWVEETLHDVGDLAVQAPMASALGWKADADGASWAPASLAADRFSKGPVRLERTGLGEGLLHERLTSGTHRLDILLALTPEAQGRAMGRLLIWWSAPAVFSLGAMDLRTSARGYLRGLANSL